MKHEKLVTALWGFFLAFLLSLSATACVITGFGMAVDLGFLALWCGLAALVSALCFTLPFWPVPLCAWTATSILLWVSGHLENSVRALLYRISRQYDSAYGWGVLRMKHYTALEIEPMLDLVFFLFGALIAICVAWAVCRRKTAVPGFLLSFLCLAVCLVTQQTVPDSIWLYGLLFGLLLILLTHTVRREDTVRGNRAALMVSLPLALALLVLFGLTPKSRYTGQERAQAVVNSVLENALFQSVFGELTPVGNSGSSVAGGTVQLGSVGIRTQSQVEILQLHTDFSGLVYLRGRALDAYDGKTWTDSDQGVSALYWPAAEELTPLGEVRIQTRYAHGMLYLPYYVQSLDLTAMTRGLDNTKKLTQYSFTTRKLTDTLETREEGALPENAQDYLHLTDSVKKWAEPLARQITQGKESVYDRAQAIGNYVRSSARYDLKTSAMPSRKKDFAKWFLEESDTGYCVHFATSAVVLLQAAGIPARYISGYMTQVGTDCYTTVRESDAHAWAEYWLPGFGWTVLEATPSAQDTPEETLLPTPVTTENTWNWRIFGYLAAGLFLAALLGAFVQRSVRLHLRRRKLEKGSVKERLLAHWQEVALFARCLNSFPEEQLFDLAQRTKFSQHPPREEDLEPFRRYLEQARNQLKRHNVFRKLYYRFVLALY